MDKLKPIGNALVQSIKHTDLAERRGMNEYVCEERVAL
jgi:hypothetical protein